MMLVQNNGYEKNYGKVNWIDEAQPDIHTFILKHGILYHLAHRERTPTVLRSAYSVCVLVT